MCITKNTQRAEMKEVLHASKIAGNIDGFFPDA